LGGRPSGRRAARAVAGYKRPRRFV
jgi:hypothetical protein